MTTRFIATAIRHFGPERAAGRRAHRRRAPAPGADRLRHGRRGALRPARGLRAAPSPSPREAGLGLTVHAGEIGGPDSVAATLDALPVTRIGHGVRAIEDPGPRRPPRRRGASCSRSTPARTSRSGSTPTGRRIPSRGCAPRACRSRSRPTIRPISAPRSPPNTRGSRRAFGWTRGRLRRDQPNRRSARPSATTATRALILSRLDRAMTLLTIVDHPLVQHKLTLMRERDTSTAVVPPAAARDLAAARLRGHPRPADDHEVASRRR